MVWAMCRVTRGFALFVYQTNAEGDGRLLSRAMSMVLPPNVGEIWWGMLDSALLASERRVSVRLCAALEQSCLLHELVFQPLATQ